MLEIIRSLFNLPEYFWTSIRLTLALAAVTTLILVVFCIPFGHWLNTSHSKFVRLIEMICTLPIVLPPTVLGFYLLIFLSPQSAIGGLWMRLTGESLTFHFTGLVIGSVIYSMPFALQPIQNALRSVPEDMIHASQNLGAGLIQSFRDIRLPLAKKGILAGAVLAFAHTIGEFGVVLMIGGSIEGQTRVASITLYDEVQKMNYSGAHAMAIVLLALALILLSITSFLTRHHPIKWRF